jgi:two-component system phosphate regulon sensor histidine kinase PhoR
LAIPYIVALAALAATLQVVGRHVVAELYTDTMSEAMLYQVRLAAELLPWNVDNDAMDRACAVVAARVGSRVTVIAPDGAVLGDSESASAVLENHRDRPEVRAALREGDGANVRIKPQINREFLYRAWLQERPVGGARQQRIVRIASPMRPVNDAAGRLRAIIWIGCAVVALAGLVPVWWESSRLSERLKRLSAYSAAITEERVPPAIESGGDDDIGRLENRIMRMGRELGVQLTDARAEKSKLQAILGGMVEGVLVLDQLGRIVLSNQRADRLFSRPLQEGEPIINYSRDPDLHALVREVVRAGHAASLVREVTLNVGEREETLQVTAAPLAEPGKEPDRFVLVFHDVTEIKHLERVRRDFVANVSHEIRTPLTAVRGYAETLRNGAIDDPERALTFLDVIERHSERLTRLTDDLLTLSDLELGRASMRHGKTNLAPVVDTAMYVVRGKAEKRGVRLVRDLPANLPPLIADQDRLVQVLVNLIDNAVKYTEAGGSVTVIASTGPPPRVNGHASDRDGVELRVTDTGIGIPSQDLPRLTERFYRVDKARSRDLGGTGLGLAIVKHIVQAHDGALKIESELGRGTTVRVWLPLGGSR